MGRKIDLIKDTIDKHDIKALCEWLQQDETPQLTKGDITVKLERKWADMVGTKHSVYVNSGSSAILLLLAAYKETLSDPVIVVPALSWATDVSSPLLLGYDIHLCDCNLHDLSCDLKQLEHLFVTISPDIFLSVSVLGLVPDMSKIIQLCNQYDVDLIEDNCESMWSSCNGKKLGTFGLASVFSMYFGHHVSTIEGGLINTDNDELYDVLLAMRSHGWDRDWSEEKKTKERDRWGVGEFKSIYTFYYPGFNVRSTDLQAFIGLRALDKLPSFAETRSNNFHYYNNRIEGSLLDIHVNDVDFISNFAYPVASYRRDEIVRALTDGGVAVRPLIAGSIAKAPFWRKLQGGIYENASMIDDYGFYLPNYQGLTHEDIDYVIDIINRYA